MMKTFSSLEEAFDKAKEMGLTPEKAAKSVKHLMVVLLSMMKIEESQ